MSRRVICFAAFFFCLFLTGLSLCQAATKTVQTTENASKETIVIIDGKERTRQVAEAIKEKIPVEILTWEQAETRKKEIKEAKLILFGMEKGEEQWIWELFQALQSMKGRRVSFFYVGDDVAMLEEELLNQGCSFLPAFGLSWNEAEREDELARMDGWLTTAFTYENKN